MKETKKFYTGIFLTLCGIFCAYFIGQKIVDINLHKMPQGSVVDDTDFGNFLVAQHALYVNDFDMASKAASSIKANNKTVTNVQSLADFFNGKLPQNAASFKDSKELLNGLIYDAFLIQKEDWKSVYNRHEKDKTILAAPLRIFPGVKQGKTKEIHKYLDSLKVDDSWKAFIKGQIAVLNNDIDAAAKEFAKVHPDFMNINEYLYLMSFYKENDMVEDMKILHDDFVAKPGGMYIADYPEIPDWSNYAGYKNNMVFAIIQNISHMQVMVYTDLSLMFLRFAQIISSEANLDAANYYLGQYYFYNSGDYKTCFKNIKKSSPLYLFGQLHIAEKAKDFKTIKKIARNNPLFIPAIQLVVREYIKTGNKNGALRVFNRALKSKNIPDASRVYLLKQRAYVYLMFGDSRRAQDDLNTVKVLTDNITLDIMSLQAYAWLLQNNNLDTAYNYAMASVKYNTSDVYAWDLVARIVRKKEGLVNALEIMESVSMAANISSFYEHFGDLYMELGDKEKALRAYEQALDLSEDGFVVVPFVQKKIRKLK